MTDDIVSTVSLVVALLITFSTSKTSNVGFIVSVIVITQSEELWGPINRSYCAHGQ